MAQKTAKALECKKSPFLKGTIPKTPLVTDDLNRSGFAKSIAELIIEDASAEKSCPQLNKTIQDLSSTVVGIEGDWGSGKSHTIKLIEKQFEGKSKSEYTWLYFEPWQFKDREHLAEIYLNWLHKKLMQQTSGGKIITFLKSGVGKFSWLSPLYVLLVTLPEVTTNLFLSFKSWLIALIGYSWLQNNLVGLARLVLGYKKAVRENKNLESSKQKIFRLLESENFPVQRFIVVIEDIDRLSPRAVLDTLQMVKMVANFPRTTYLVPYDRKHTVSAINILDGFKSSDKYGEGFIDKTLQTSFTLPTIGNEELFSLYTSWLKRLSNRYYAGAPANKDAFNTNRWNTLRQFIITEQDLNPRSIEKLYNRSLFFFSTLKDNSNPADITLVSFLLEFYPNVVKAIKKALNQKSMLNHKFFEDDWLTRTEKILTDKLPENDINRTGEIRTDKALESDIKLLHSLKDLAKGLSYGGSSWLAIDFFETPIFYLSYDGSHHRNSVDALNSILKASNEDRPDAIKGLFKSYTPEEMELSIAWLTMHHASDTELPKWPDEALPTITMLCEMKEVYDARLGASINRYLLKLTNNSNIDNRILELSDTLIKKGLYDHILTLTNKSRIEVYRSTSLIDVRDFKKENSSRIRKKLFRDFKENFSTEKNYYDLYSLILEWKSFQPRISKSFIKSQIEQNGYNFIQCLVRSMGKGALQQHREHIVNLLENKDLLDAILIEVSSEENI